MNRRGLIAAFGAVLLWCVGWFSAGASIGVTSGDEMITGAEAGFLVLGLSVAVLVSALLVVALVFVVMNWVVRGEDRDRPF